MMIRWEGKPWVVDSDEADLLPAPFDKVPLSLRPVSPIEDPSVTDIHAVQETFLGGEGFVRIGGAAVWTEDEPEEHVYSDASFVASVGYEDYFASSGMVTGRPFFIGELCLYFLLSPTLRKVVVLAQSS
jgi:hypothetical protein